VPILMQAEPAPAHAHAAASAQLRGQAHQRVGSGELRPCPRAPSGIFRPSKRKSSGDPCVTVDQEPTGTAPESDLLPAGAAALHSVQRPRRDRSSFSSLERRYADYVTSSLPSPARTVAVAVRSYPPAVLPARSPAVNETKAVTARTPTSAVALACTEASGGASTPSVAEKTKDNCMQENLGTAAGLDPEEAGNVSDNVGESETALVDSEPNSSQSPASGVRPVAVRRYPAPAPVRGVGGAGRGEESRSAARKAALSAVSRRFRRSKPHLTLRARYAARARAAQRRAAALESGKGSGVVEKLELGPLQLSARPKVERVVPDLLSAAGVVSTKGPFDCDDDTSTLPALPALAVVAKTHSVLGTDAMALPTLEGVDVFEVSNLQLLFAVVFGLAERVVC
jgi:hypothetical protein